MVSTVVRIVILLVEAAARVDIKLVYFVLAAQEIQGLGALVVQEELGAQVAKCIAARLALRAAERAEMEQTINQLEMTVKMDTPISETQAKD